MRNLWKIILASVAITLVVCLIMNSAIKRNAFRKSLDERLVESFIVGSYIELSDNQYAICTDENIDRVKINSIYVDSSIFGTCATISFRVTVNTCDSQLRTNGVMKLEYSPKSPCRWTVDEVRILA